jgi:MYXO-CTERM domain-containing protein
VGLTETLSEQSCNVATLTGTSVTGISISGFAKATVDTGSTQTFGLQFIASGSISGGQAVDVPLSWDFTDELLSGAAENLSYDLQVMINGNLLFNKSGAPSGGTITSSTTLSLPADATSYSVSLLIDGTAAGAGSALTATIPSGSSIDVQAQNASTPEPSTLALAASALGSLFWWRRRKA